MLYIKSFDELLDILREGAFEEDCSHACYIADTEKISSLLESINKLTKAVPEFIDFNNFIGEGCPFYNLSLDYDEGDLRYSITPAIDEDGGFYTDFGLCLVDECVPKSFEKDYKFGEFDRDYQSPIRINWGEEPSEDNDDDCKKCTYDCKAPCCKKNNTEEKTKIDTDDEGNVCGFTKSWKDNNSYFTYSYHSTDENDVLDLMKKFNISRS